MGVVNTTYTFSGTDTITSAKLNNIIDDTTFTSDAIQGTTLQVVSPGKLAVNAGGITSNELASNSVVTAAITDSNVTTAKIADSNVTTAKIADANVTQVKLAPNVAGNGPAFSAYQTIGTNQVLTANSWTNVITLNAELFDTNNNFSTSTYKFTPTVAGYYQVSGEVGFLSPAVIAIGIFKNGVVVKYGSSSQSGTGACATGIIQMNGTTDYLELRAYSNTTATIPGGPEYCFFDGFLARSA